MPREANNKIAEWLGWKWKTPPKGQTWNPYFEDETGDSRHYPFFSECDADAIMLPPLLIKKGYDVELRGIGPEWMFVIYGTNKTDSRSYRSYAPTIAAAISATVVKLIESI